MDDVPKHVSLERERGLTVEWQDGKRSFFPVAYLRANSPSADARTLREKLAANPLTVLPSSRSKGPLIALDAELVGRYAVRIRFSDGHDTGIFSWRYLREIDKGELDRSAVAPNAPTNESPEGRS
ncbi:MAG: DUF971 domain-containing protein [Phycisphaerae bacterium]|nr:DUF971 domain-containing protein [Phycisphaerae bacterium]